MYMYIASQGVYMYMYRVRHMEYVYTLEHCTFKGAGGALECTLRWSASSCNDKQAHVNTEHVKDTGMHNIIFLHVYSHVVHLGPAPCPTYLRDGDLYG